MESSSPIRPMDIQLPRGLAILLTVAAGFIGIAGLRAFASSIGPIFLALVVVVVVSPIYTWLHRRGAPSWLAGVALLITSFGVLSIMFMALVWTGTELALLLRSDEYTSRFGELQTEVESLMGRFGFTNEDIGEVVDGIDVASVVGQVTSALSSLLSVSSAIILVLITMLFMVMDTGKWIETLDRVAVHRPAIADALRKFARQTRAYFVVSTIFGLIVSALDVTALLILGVPLPFVWGVLALITNYIPNIGFVLGLAPPAFLAFFEGGWQLSVWVIVVYFAINTVVQSVIQPKIVGDAVGLSATLTFVSLIFWGWVMGALGALLAVPMTLLSKALLIDADPGAKWVEPLISLSDTEPAGEVLSGSQASDLEKEKDEVDDDDLYDHAESERADADVARTDVGTDVVVEEVSEA